MNSTTELGVLSAWQALEAYHAQIALLHLRQLFADDPERAKSFSAEGAGRRRHGKRFPSLRRGFDSLHPLHAISMTQRRSSCRSNRAGPLSADDRHGIPGKLP